MNRTEVAKVLYVVKATYPRFYKDYSEEDTKDLLSAWTAVLKVYTYEQATAGLQAYLATDTKGFPPSPGQIVDRIQFVRDTDNLTATEAWTLVKKALRNSNYGSEEEFAKLPEIVQRAVGSAASLRDMAQLPSDTVNSVEQSHFIRTYNTLVERQSEEAKIPLSVTQTLLGLVENSGRMKIETARSNAELKTS
ncbi:MAG: replicative helicase loader/inhibitor [Eubacteriales bacterium]|nr:replicative helicase loader/inhibitor [Eubacteriales bacterium]